LAFVARFGLFTFEESPKFLVSKQRDMEAVNVVNRVRAFNVKKDGIWAKIAFWKKGERSEVASRQESSILSIEELEACEKEWELRENERERIAAEMAKCSECVQHGSVDGLPPVLHTQASSSSPSTEDSIRRQNNTHIKADESEGDRLDAEAGHAMGTRKAEMKMKGVKKHLGHLLVLFSTCGMARLTILTWICYAADYW
jgi:hypothetical protein